MIVPVRQTSTQSVQHTLSIKNQVSRYSEHLHSCLRVFGETANTAVDHRWQVRDTNSGDSVDVRFTNTGWTDVPGPVEPETSYASNEVFGCRYKGSEDEGWRYGARSEVPCDDDAETIDGEDIVLWYKGFLPHPVNPGDDQAELWHSSGVRLVVNLNESGNNAPVVTNPGAQSSIEGQAVNLSVQASDADGDILRAPLLIACGLCVT